MLLRNLDDYITSFLFYYNGTGTSKDTLFAWKYKMHKVLTIQYPRIFAWREIIHLFICLWSLFWRNLCLCLQEIFLCENCIFISVEIMSRKELTGLKCQLRKRQNPPNIFRWKNGIFWCGSLWIKFVLNCVFLAPRRSPVNMLERFIYQHLFLCVLLRGCVGIKKRHR